MEICCSVKSPPTHYSFLPTNCVAVDLAAVGVDAVGEKVVVVRETTAFIQLQIDLTVCLTLRFNILNSCPHRLGGGTATATFNYVDDRTFI